jgi:hypothetical protein
LFVIWFGLSNRAEVMLLISACSKNTAVRLTKQQSAELLGCSAKTVQRRVNSGVLPAERETGQVMIEPRIWNSTGAGPGAILWLQCNRS